MTLPISADNAWLLTTVIVAGVALSIWLEQNFNWAAKLSGALIAIVLAMALSNCGIMPPEAPTYDLVQSHLVLVALPLLLFRANFFEIIRSTRWLFLAFHCAALGTVLGAFLAAALLHRYVDKAPEVAAIMTGSYTGGMVNFSAVKETYKVPESVTNPLIVADNFIMAAVFMLLLLMAASRFVRRFYPHPHCIDAVDSRELAAAHWRRKEVSLLDISLAVAIAVAIVTLALNTSAWVESQIDNRFIREIVGNKYIHITLFSLLIATFGQRFLARINGAEEIGGYILYVYLFVIGLPADLYEVFTNAPLLVLFCLIMAATNIVVTFVLGYLFRLNLEDLVIAVNTTLGGPATGAAVAIAGGWKDLVLPGVLAGIWGYTIGTALGLAVGGTLRAWL